MAEKIERALVEKVATSLEKYANDAQLSALENLAKVAVFQETVAREKAAAFAAQTVPTVPDSAKDKLHRSLAAAVGLGRA